VEDPEILEGKINDQPFWVPNLERRLLNVVVKQKQMLKKGPVPS
jgi:hypothetical protein